MVRVMTKDGVWRNVEDEFLEAIVRKHYQNQRIQITSLLPQGSIDESRNRFVNTRVKKTINKKRDKQLKEARRLALLQKHYKSFDELFDLEKIDFKSLHIDDAQLKCKSQEDLSINKRSELVLPSSESVQLRQDTSIYDEDQIVLDQPKRGQKRRKEEYFEQQLLLNQSISTTFRPVNTGESISDILQAEELIKHEMLLLHQHNSVPIHPIEEFTDDELAAARSLLESEMNRISHT